MIAEKTFQLNILVYEMTPNCFYIVSWSDRIGTRTTISNQTRCEWRRRSILNVLFFKEVAPRFAFEYFQKKKIRQYKTWKN